MRTVIGDRVIDDVVTVDPVEHLADVGGTIPVAEQPPFGEGDRLVVPGRELGLGPQPVRLLDVVGELLARPLVVAVHADDVDHVVTRVALRPRDRVVPPVGGEVELEALAGRGAHGHDDAPPVLLPRLRVGGAPAGVRGAVHLPAEHDDRVSGAGGDQPPGQPLEVVVVEAARARGEPLGHRVVGHAGLVRGDHRHVQRQHPVGVGGPPAGPGAEDGLGSLDGLPSLAGQVGAAHRGLVPQPRLEALQPSRAVPVRGQENAQGRVAAWPVVRSRSHPLTEAEQCHSH